MNGCLFAVPIANFPIFKTQINCGRWQQFADFHLCHVFIFEMLKMHIELEYLSVICYTNFYLPNTEIQISGISHSFLRWCPAICPNWNWFFFLNIYSFCWTNIIRLEIKWLSLTYDRSRDASPNSHRFVYYNRYQTAEHQNEHPRLSTPALKKM